MIGLSGSNTLLISVIMILAACSSHNRWTGQERPAFDRPLVIDTARRQLGIAYKYGGTSPSEGFDCSGLVFYSFLNAGISLPRTTVEQYRATRPIRKDRIKRGDLLFFKIYRSKISHVGIYLGNRRFIHAPSSGKTVEVANLDNPYWRKHFVGARRV